MNIDLAKKLKTLPRSPGVYFHKSLSGEVIYVGKAASLKSRVRQYFQDSATQDVKTRALIAEIVDTDWIETDSEVDALFLESEMVKRYMPRYNILLRDDKSQLYVRINMTAEWPHVSFTRHPLGDDAEYIGPFYSGGAVRKALRYLRRTFPYYSKSPKIDTRPSLTGQLGLEPVGMTSDEYKSSLRQLISYLKGNRQAIVRDFERMMKMAATEQDFETAAVYRNRLRSLSELKRRIMFGNSEFLDASKDRALQQLKLLLGLGDLPVHIEGFDISHSSGDQVVASQVVFKNGVSTRENYRKYKMRFNRNDDTANIYEAVFRRMSPRNVSSWGKPDLIIIDGGKGQLSAASRAVTDRGVTLPVISFAKRNDELYIHSEYSYVKTTQLNEMMSVAPQGVSVTLDNSYFCVNLHADQLNAGEHSRNLRGGTTSAMVDALLLLQRIRDESHRFAISYHSTISRRKQTNSQLDQIPGIGPVTKRKLLTSFGSYKSLQSADLDRIIEVVGPAKAAIITNYITNPKDG